MKARRIWLVSLILTLTVTVFGLLGCSFVGEPNNAEDLLVRFAANPNNVNCVTTADMDINIAISGFHGRIPVTISSKSADTTAHGTVVADLSSIGGGVQNYEFYGELVDNTAIRAYVKRSDKKAMPWKRIEVDSSFKIDIPLVVNLLSDAKFMRVSYESDDQVRYELTLPAKTLADTVLGMGEVSTSVWEVDQNALDDMLSESKLHVCFNEDCLVRSVTLGLSFTYVDKDVIALPVKVNLNLNTESDGYGSVDPSEVAIPDEVREQSELSDFSDEVEETSNEIMSSAS